MSKTASSSVGQGGGSDGRDARGRFAPGNAGGPGNPFARQTARLRKALLETVTEDDMRQVAVTLVLLAKAANLAAIKLLFQYVIGKPAESVDPDRLEIEEWKLSQESQVGPGQVRETMQQLPAEAANFFVRHGWLAAVDAGVEEHLRRVAGRADGAEAEPGQASPEEGVEQGAAPAEANGGNGAPHPRPLPHKGAGEEGEGGDPPARGERSATPHAAPRPAATSPQGRTGPAAGGPAGPRAGGAGRRAEANGGNGTGGRERHSAGGNGKSPPEGGAGPRSRNGERDRGRS